jgi:hypothetical protein
VARRRQGHAHDLCHRVGRRCPNGGTPARARNPTSLTLWLSLLVFDRCETSRVWHGTRRTRSTALAPSTGPLHEPLASVRAQRMKGVQLQPVCIEAQPCQGPARKRSAHRRHGARRAKTFGSDSAGHRCARGTNRHGRSMPAAGAQMHTFQKYSSRLDPPVLTAPSGCLSHSARQAQI